MDLTARFLNLETAGRRPVPTPREVLDEPVEGVVKTGPVQRQRRLDETRVLDLVAAYVAGETVAGVARQFGIDEQTAHAHLNRMGVPRRAYQTVTDDKIDVAVQLYLSGVSIRQVARELGVHERTARKVLVEAGVTIRSPGR